MTETTHFSSYISAMQELSAEQQERRVKFFVRSINEGEDILRNLEDPSSKPKIEQLVRGSKNLPITVEARSVTFADNSAAAHERGENSKTVWFANISIGTHAPRGKANPESDFDRLYKLIEIAQNLRPFPYVLWSGGKVVHISVPVDAKVHVRDEVLAIPNLTMHKLWHPEEHQVVDFPSRPGMQPPPSVDGEKLAEVSADIRKGDFPSRPGLGRLPPSVDREKLAEVLSDRLKGDSSVIPAAKFPAAKLG